MEILTQTSIMQVKTILLKMLAIKADKIKRRIKRILLPTKFTNWAKPEDSGSYNLSRPELKRP